MTGAQRSREPRVTGPYRRKRDFVIESLQGEFARCVDEEDAKRIVLCVNVHEELVQAMQDMLREHDGPRWPAARDRASSILAEIANAEGSAS